LDVNLQVLQPHSKHPVQYETIRSDASLRECLNELGNQSTLAFDTEFVSEDRYRPELCLIQVASAGKLFVIDPLPSVDTTPFWDFITTPGRTVIAHAAREECGFCYRITGKKIAGLFDVQLAAGFVGMEYPISLGNLVQRLRGKLLPKGESRTNWRNRPLTPSQIEYALHDVTELEAMHENLAAQVETLGRLWWLEEETDAMQESVIDREESQRWRRVSGSNGLPPRSLEVLRCLWSWRESRAKELDQPARRILRDDLMVELAKRQSDSPDRIRGIRGMERRGLNSQMDEIAAAIHTALQTPEDDLPRRARGTRRVVSPMLTQFLSTSIACVCRQHRMAPSIVGNSEDIRDLLAYELERDGKDDKPSDELPKLMAGWRGQVVGKSFRDLLEGRLAIRVDNKFDEQPLEFVRVSPEQESQIF
jgi:ribonuclease D